MIKQTAYINDIEITIVFRGENLIKFLTDIGADMNKGEFTFEDVIHKRETNMSNMWKEKLISNKMV